MMKPCAVLLGLSCFVYVALGQAETCHPLRSALTNLVQATPCLKDVCSCSCPQPSNIPAITAPAKPITTHPSNDVNGKPVPGKPAFQVGTYIPNWFVYKKHYLGAEKMSQFGVAVDPLSGEAKYTFWPRQIRDQMPLLTHLYYAFLDLNSDCVVTDVDPDASWYGATAEPAWIPIPTSSCKGLMNDFLSLKEEFAHLKLMISLGGWTYSKNFPHCASTPEGRQKIYKTFSFFVGQMDSNWGKEGGYWSGVDFDWEFPAVDEGLHKGSTPNDWENYVTLIDEFRANAHAEGRNAVVITSAIGLGNSMNILVGKPNVAASFCRSLDFVNLMSYDLHGKWEAQTGHNAPFCPDNTYANARPLPTSGRSVLETTEKMLSVCPAGKLALGLPNYSPGWTDVPAGDRHGEYQISAKASYSNEGLGEGRIWSGWSSFSDRDNELTPQGILAFWDLKQTIASNSDFVVHSRKCPVADGVEVPVKFVYSEKRHAFAGYDDEEVTAAKTKWAKKRGLGGFFFWDTQQDKNGDLLKAAREGWGELPVHAATGQSKCFDDRKPNYSLDWQTGKQFQCQQKGRVFSIAVGDTCFGLQQKAQQICGAQAPTPIGGEHGGQPGQCTMVCTRSWGAGAGPWVNDKVYYICGSESPDAVQDVHPGSVVSKQPVGNGGYGACLQSGRSFTVKPGNTCGGFKIEAEAKCGAGNSKAIGGDRQGECINACSATWGEGSGPLWVGDVVYWKCKDE